LSQLGLTPSRLLARAAVTKTYCLANFNFLATKDMAPIVNTGDSCLNSHQISQRSSGQSILDKAWHFVEEALRKPSYQSDRCVGAEIELALVSSKGDYLPGSAIKLLKKLNDQSKWHPESGSGTIEYVTRPYKLIPNLLTKLARDVKADLGLLSDLASKQNYTVVGSGILPIMRDREIEQPKYGTDNQNDRIAYNKLDALLGIENSNTVIPYKNDLNTNFSITQGHECWRAINSLHVTFQAKNPNDALRIFNSLQALTPTMIGLSANTGHVNGKQLAYQESRPFIISGSGPVDYNHRNFCGLVLEHASNIKQAFEILMPKIASAICPTVNQFCEVNSSLRHNFEAIRESIFPSIQLRFHPNKDGVFLVEYRLMSVQPTAQNNIALIAFLSMLISSELNFGIESYDKETKLKDSLSAMQNGLEAEVLSPLVSDRGKKLKIADIATNLSIMLSNLDNKQFSSADFQLIRPLIKDVRRNLNASAKLTCALNKGLTISEMVLNNRY
jgi:gamma-glutamyl:cysteine ligase YbdK (ATP-grasp superfamily)